MVTTREEKRQKVFGAIEEKVTLGTLVVGVTGMMGRPH